MRILRFLPPLAWTMAITWFSGEGWSAPGTSRIFLPLLGTLLPWATPEQIEALHWLARKAAHFTEYAILAGLWHWAVAPRLSWARRAAFGLSVLTAALDEIHQSGTLSRTGSPADVALDAAGAAAALLVLACGWQTLDRVIGALLWIAAGGGTAMIAVNWAAAAPSGWLWLSVAAAWIALFAWRRSRGRVRAEAPGSPPSISSAPRS